MNPISVTFYADVPVHLKASAFLIASCADANGCVRVRDIPRAMHEQLDDLLGLVECGFLVPDDARHCHIAEECMRAPRLWHATT